MSKEITAILTHTLPPEQHLGTEVKLGTRGGFSIFSRKSPPLLRLWKAKHITFEQRIAGERLEELAHTSGLYCPSAMVIGERVGGSGERKMSERQLEAWQGYFRACKEVERQYGSETLQTVVSVAVYGCSPLSTRLLPVNRRVRAVRLGLQTLHDFLFTPRELTASI